MPMSRLSTLVNLRVSQKRLYCCEKFFFSFEEILLLDFRQCLLHWECSLFNAWKLNLLSIHSLYNLHCTIIHVTISEAIVSLEHRLRGMKVAPQPEHHLRGEKCKRVKKEAPQPRGRCSLWHGARVEAQTCFLVGNNSYAISISLLFTIRS